MHPRELWDTSLRELNKGSSLDMSYARCLGENLMKQGFGLDWMLWGNRSNSVAEMLSKSRRKDWNKAKKSCDC